MNLYTLCKRTEIEDVNIAFVDSLPNHDELQRFYGMTLEQYTAYEAVMLEGVLYDTLPKNIYDRLLTQMLSRKENEERGQ